MLSSVRDAIVTGGQASSTDDTPTGKLLHENAILIGIALERREHRDHPRTTPDAPGTRRRMTEGIRILGRGDGSDPPTYFDFLRRRKLSNTLRNTGIHRVRSDSFAVPNICHVTREAKIVS